MNRFYFYYSLICTISFLSGSVVFFFVYNNIPGGIWAAFAGCIAGAFFQLCKLYFDHRLQNMFSLKTLDYLAIFSFIVCLVGWMFTVWYSFAIIYWKIPIKPYNKSFVFPCVFSFLSGKWGFHLYIAAKKYSRDYIASNYSPLIQNI